MNLYFFRLDWRFVRSLGELHILTRASYIMLGLVPILAGIWSKLPSEIAAHPLADSWVYAFLAALSVTLGQVIYQIRAPEIVRRSTLDEYIREERQHYSEQPTTERLEAADLDLERESGRDISAKELSYYYPPANDLRRLEIILEDIEKRSGESLEMLRPDMTEEKFVRLFGGDKRESVRGAAFDRNITAQALRYLSEALVSDYSKKEMYYYHHRCMQFHRCAVNFPASAALLRVAFPGVEERDRLHNITKVGNSARLRYLLEAERRKLAMSAASILYVAAIVLIAVITVDQTKAVLTAAGWGWP